MSSTAEKTIISAAVGEVNLTVCTMEKVGKKAVQKLLYDCSEMQFRCKNPSEIQKNSRIQSRQKSNFEFQPKVLEQTQWNTFQPKYAGILPNRKYSIIY